jgi:hypothetical protein
VAFKLLIYSHYPNTDLEVLERNLKAARNHKEPKGAKKAAPASQFSVETTPGGVLLVKTPYSDTFRMEVKRRCRGKWSKAFKAWEVSEEHLDALKDVIAESFDKPKVLFK